MRLFSERIPSVGEIGLLLALGLTGSVLRAPAASLVASGPTLPPAPWEQVQVASGPTLPPAPWEQVQVASGPTLPPAPWEQVRRV
jgi:hypothetical protein